MDTSLRQKTTNYKPLIWTLAATINLLIAIAFFLPEIDYLKQFDFSFLPLTNAILNSLTFISLTIALLAIKLYQFSQLYGPILLVHDLPAFISSYTIAKHKTIYPSLSGNVLCLDW